MDPDEPPPIAANFTRSETTDLCSPVVEEDGNIAIHPWYLWVSVGGTPLRALVDTGAMRTYLTPRA